ncbi:XK-related protein 4-like [Erpetoichthys calabaricus]|uniref:XK-related protein 4-like n=1 Tax=Erpetoichthys calabaricus TaxID=27687 RepID=UPI0022343EEA|nr:XK-related protein 4-like [Erpetoichthys calabaricus]
MELPEEGSYVINSFCLIQKSFLDAVFLRWKYSRTQMFRRLSQALGVLPSSRRQPHSVICELDDAIAFMLCYTIIGFTAAASLVSLAWALASYQKALRDSRDDKKPISYLAVIIQFCWHFFTIAARVITFALFASVFQLYFGIFIVLHWCIMTFWIVHCETEFCITKWEEIVFDMVVGIIYIFSWFNVKEGRTRCRLFIYYFVILLENTALSALWYLYRVPHSTDSFAIPALCVIFSSFLTGIVFMLMYYAFFHPNGPKFGQSPSCTLEDPSTTFTLPPEAAANALRAVSQNRGAPVMAERDPKYTERDGCVPVFQVRPTAPSTPSSRTPRIEETVIKIDLFRNRYPAWERHVLDRSIRKAILAFECSPAPPRLQYKDDALVQERLEYETTL